MFKHRLVEGFRCVVNMYFRLIHSSLSRNLPSISEIIEIAIKEEVSYVLEELPNHDMYLPERRPRSAPIKHKERIDMQTSLFDLVNLVRKSTCPQAS